MEKKKNSDKLLLRLEKYVTKRGDSLAGLAKTLGLSYSYFSRAKTTNGSIGSDVLILILQHYKDLSADWLLTGEGSMFKGKISAKGIKRYQAMEDKFLETQKMISLIEQNMERLKKLQNEYKKLR